MSDTELIDRTFVGASHLAGLLPGRGTSMSRAGTRESSWLSPCRPGSLASNPGTGSHSPTARGGRTVRLLAGLLGVCLILGSHGVARAASDRLPEYQVKAAFVYNIAKFVDWPGPRAIATNGTVVIGVLGRNPFGTYLSDLTNNAVVRVPAPEVRQVTGLKEARECHLLFISESEKDRLPELFQALQGYPVLTIGDTDQFGERGGMINFVLVRQSVKLEVNLAVARRVGLRISSKLLALARLVETSPASSGDPPAAQSPGRED